MKQNSIILRSWLRKSKAALASKTGRSYQRLSREIEGLTEVLRSRSAKKAWRTRKAQKQIA